MASTARNHVIAPVRLPTILRGLALATLAGLSLPATPARADTLLIENVARAPAPAERPARGSSMASVQNRFGAPAGRSGPVGQPPITRWDYQGFVVFFEYNHVVHSVLR